MSKVKTRSRLRPERIAVRQALLWTLPPFLELDRSDANGLVGANEENKVAGKNGGGIARKALPDLEDKTGRSVVTGENFLPPGKRKVD
jgi:hypothetical protein